MKKGDNITWLSIIDKKITRLTGKIVDNPVGGVFKAIGVDHAGRSFSDLLHVSDKSISMPDPSESDAHSCHANEVPGSDGNRYCDVCGRMTKSADAIELDAERYNYDRQAGDFETF